MISQDQYSELKNKIFEVKVAQSISLSPLTVSIETAPLYSECKGKYLMRSRYAKRGGRGRPRKDDYEEYNSYADLMDLRTLDLLGFSFSTTYA